MKHAFSNVIKILVSKLLAYLVSTFCKWMTGKYNAVDTAYTVSEQLLKITQHCLDTVDTFSELYGSQKGIDSVEEVK